MTLALARHWCADTQMDLMDYRFRLEAGVPIFGMHHDLTVKRAAHHALEVVRALEAAAQKAEAA